MTLRASVVLAVAGLISAQSDGETPSVVDAFDLKVHADEVCGRNVSGIYRFKGRSEEHAPYYYREGLGEFEADMNTPTEDLAMHLSYLVCTGDMGPAWFFTPTLPTPTNQEGLCSRAQSFLVLPMDSPGDLSVVDEALWEVSSCETEVSVSILPMQPHDDDQVLMGFKCRRELNGLWKVVPDSLSYTSPRPMYHMESFGGAFVMMYKEDFEECPHLNNRWSIWSAQDMDGVCHNYDDEATDSEGKPCWAYKQNPSSCGASDTDDFVASTMCCACGGGELAGGEGFYPCRAMASSQGVDELRPLQFGWYEECDNGEVLSAPVEAISRTRSMMENPCKEHLAHYIGDNICYSYDPMANCPYHCERMVRIAEESLCIHEDLMWYGMDNTSAADGGMIPILDLLHGMKAGCEPNVECYSKLSDMWSEDWDHCFDAVCNDTEEWFYQPCLDKYHDVLDSCSGTQANINFRGMSENVSDVWESKFWCEDDDENNGGGNCMDVDYGAVDSLGDGCDWYDGKSDACGAYDTETFYAYSMCCACGGGSGGDGGGGGHDAHCVMIPMSLAHTVNAVHC